MEIFVFDGAMGTMLQERGLKAGQSPEELNLLAPEIVKSVHLDYLNAGCDVITTNTFGGSRLKLQEYQLEEKLVQINENAVQIAKEAVRTAGHGLVAASIGPTGHFVEPLGEMTFEAIYAVFYEQALALAGGKPDYFILETFSDLGEIRAALLACRDAAQDIPVICSMTYMPNQRTLTGVSPGAAAVTLSAMGAAVIGCNCSGGPEELLSVIDQSAQYTDLPLIVQPNAGLPIYTDGAVRYPLTAENFAPLMAQFLSYQLQFVGGCCGTTPNHISALKETVYGFTVQKRAPIQHGMIASREEVIAFGSHTLPKIIGERINPTARKKLAQSLRDNDLSMVQSDAQDQMAAGAHLLDINVGAHGLDQKATMTRIVSLLQQGAAIPLVIDSTDKDVLAQALAQYHGKALINSVNGEDKSLHEILPLAKRFGAAVVALTLDEDGIPPTAEGRLTIARHIVHTCAQYGIAPKDIFVDALVMTVGTDNHAPMETLRAMRLIKEELGVNLLLGVSNVSHGLPNRSQINSAFLAMAIANGLDAAIINPLDELMMKSWQSAALLSGRDARAANYLALNTVTEEAAPQTVAQDTPSLALVADLVVKGGQAIVKVVQALLDEGFSALEIINEGLIVGLNEVGERYEKGVYYLPQLMLSAETAQKAFDLLAEKMESGTAFHKGTMVIGTVKGDIHDIGKNMVAVMIKNHGYQVIDLGKNVPSQLFIDTVVAHDAEFLGLSALMTTTMIEIPPIIQMLRQVHPQTKVIIGGAVITEDFAHEAGADGYGRDAVSTVKLMNQLLGGENE